MIDKMTEMVFDLLEKEEKQKFSDSRFRTFMRCICNNQGNKNGNSS